jgi:hypothetical protein
MQDIQPIVRLPPAVLRAYSEIIRRMAQTARTSEVVPSLLALADRFEALAHQQEEQNLA